MDLDDGISSNLDVIDEDEILQETIGEATLVAEPVASVKNASLTDKDFYKAMQKIKDRVTGNKPPKKPASAYILFQKEVSLLFFIFPLKTRVNFNFIILLSFL